MRSWGDDVSRYKGKERYGEVLLEYLDRRHEEQVEEGLDVEGRGAGVSILGRGSGQGGGERERLRGCDRTEWIFAESL
jgi:hypothetical protein